LWTFTVCFGWGREGRRIIAMVAEDHLDETTKVMIQSLIGNNHLYSVANWTDEIRKERRETAPWHYVNVPLGSTYNAKHGSFAGWMTLADADGEGKVKV
jgi:hypothetical protein